MKDPSSTGPQYIEEISALKKRIQELEKSKAECRRIEEDLRESKRQCKLITDKMTDIVWIQDMNLRTVYVSPSIEMALGFTPEERVAQKVTEQLTPASLSVALNALAGELELEQQGHADPKS
jgi:PAS domain-containing protein